MASSADQERETVTVHDTVTIVVNQQHAGTRLDQLISLKIPDISRSRIISSIRSGLLLVDGALRKPSYKLKVGEVITGSLFVPSPPKVTPQKIDFPILYEDEVLLIINKPPGLVVHPGSGNVDGTLVNGVVYYCNSIAEVGDEIRPGIVHRLDKDTSGVMVIAKTDQAHSILVEQFKSREVQKEYLALVHGIFFEPNGRIVASIGRHPVNRQKMAVREGQGKYAASRWAVLQEFDNALSYVRVKIETGRTHQIRVHLAHLGHPVAGDDLYGSGKNNSLFNRQMLHASKLVIHHPVSSKKQTFTAPLWPDMQQVVDQLASSA